MKEDNTLWYDKVINEAIKNNESSKLAAPQQETSKEDPAIKNNESSKLAAPQQETETSSA